MTTETKGLHEERLKQINDARALIETAEADNRDLNTEEQTKYDKLFGDADALKKRIDRMETQATAEADNAGKLPDVIGDEPEGSDKTFTQKELDKVVTKRFVHGEDSLSKNEQKAISQYQKEEDVFWKNMKEGYSSLNEDEKKIYHDVIQSRQQATTPGSKGGFFVPKQFQLEFDKALLEFGGMREAARVIKTDKGGTLDWPTVNDTSNTGRWLSENTTVTDTEVVFGQVQFNDFTRSSDMVRVSMQLLNDSAFDLPNFLRDILAERIGRGTNQAFTVGDGSAKPRGVTLDTVEGVTAALASAITSDEIIDLFHSVDAAYRKNPKAWWMFSDLTLKAIRKLKDADNQYLWQPGLRAGVPDLLLSKRFIVNNDVAEIGLDAKSILFGDFNKYIIRDVGGLIMLRLDERFADDLQVGFTAFVRTDGKLIDAGTAPIKHLRHPNT